MTSTHTVQQRIEVSWDFPVVFTHALFDPANPVLVTTLDRKSEHRRHRAMVFIDSHVSYALPALPQQAADYFAAHPKQLELIQPPIIVPGGEAIKNDIGLVDHYIRRLLEAHLDRQSFVIIVGGGAVMDAVGLASALVHRGLRQVRVPTTVLGQNDAGVGVKNGVNFLGGKNSIGTFAPPFAVLNDFDFLLSLPDRDWLCGVAEAFKVSIIRDRAFFSELVARAEKYPARGLRCHRQRKLVTAAARGKFISNTSAPTAIRSSTGARGRWISGTGPRTSWNSCRTLRSRTAKPWPQVWCSTPSMPRRNRGLQMTNWPKSATAFSAAVSACGSMNSTAARPMGHGRFLADCATSRSISAVN